MDLSRTQRTRTGRLGRLNGSILSQRDKDRRTESDDKMIGVFYLFQRMVGLALRTFLSDVLLTDELIELFSGPRSRLVSLVSKVERLMWLRKSTGER